LWKRKKAKLVAKEEGELVEKKIRGVSGKERGGNRWKRKKGERVEKEEGGTCDEGRRGNYYEKEDEETYGIWRNGAC